MSPIHIVAAVLIGTLAPYANCLAEDVYIVRPLQQITLDSPLSETVQANSSPWSWRSPARVTMKGAGEAFVTRVETAPPDRGDETLVLAIRIPQDRVVQGHLAMPEMREFSPGSFTHHRFEIPAGEATPDQKSDFLAARRARYLELAKLRVPGTAWFRHQARTLRQNEGSTTTEDDTDVRRIRNREIWQAQDLQSTFALISGGRAISENLQLDRTLNNTGKSSETVALSSLDGITVEDFNWDALLDRSQPPQMDQLATIIPADQHVVFFRSFAALSEVAAQADQYTSIVFSQVGTRSEDASLRRRYERQLGLSLTAATKALGPQLIRSVAITGGDLYLADGSDVAAIFEPNHTAVLLKSALETQIRASAADTPDVVTEQGTTDAITWTSWRSPDRSVCSYIAEIGGFVAVTNSLRQLRRLGETSQAPDKSLSVLDEYRFFRQRYPIDNQKESALIVLSDPTIRRWCSPRWRIGQSRRIRAAAWLAEIQANHLTDLVSGTVQPTVLTSGPDLPDTGEVRLEANGVRFAGYGTLGFQTPVGELNIDQVSHLEAEAYELWRAGYQNNWTQGLDPIAVKLEITDKKITTDVTVMPLIDSTDYGDLRQYSEGTQVRQEMKDVRPEAVLLATAGINQENFPPFWRSIGTSMLRMDPFDWIGDSISISVEDDALWHAPENETSDSDRNRDPLLERPPVAVSISVRNSLKLAAFLTALRAAIDQMAPNVLEWQQMTHNNQTYTCVMPTETGRQELFSSDDDLSLYYTKCGGSLLLTLNEDLIKRALDRAAHPEQAAAASRDLPMATHAPLGKHVSVQADRRLLAVVRHLSGHRYRREMQNRSWNNLFILNEWKKMYPDQSPVDLHERYWQRRLVCPGGGKYRWNENWQTMESTVYGHPGAPKSGPDMPAALSRFDFANFGLTFEENGLRARAELEYVKE